MNKQCKGCKTLVLVNYEKCECLLTKTGFSHVNNCPCLECIIKMVCLKQCDKFKENIEKDHPEIIKEILEDLYLRRKVDLKSKFYEQYTILN